MPVVPKPRPSLNPGGRARPRPPSRRRRPQPVTSVVPSIANAALSSSPAPGHEGEREALGEVRIGRAERPDRRARPARSRPRWCPRAPCRWVNGWRQRAASRSTCTPTDRSRDAARRSHPRRRNTRRSPREAPGRSDPVAAHPPGVTSSVSKKPRGGAWKPGGAGIAVSGSSVHRRRSGGRPCRPAAGRAPSAPGGWRWPTSVARVAVGDVRDVPQLPVSLRRACEVEAGHGVRSEMPACRGRR